MGAARQRARWTRHAGCVLDRSARRWSGQRSRRLCVGSVRVGRRCRVRELARWKGCEEVGRDYCFGDGSGTSCPCGNASAPGARAGCTNSFGLAGALRGSGQTSLANDTLVLTGSAMPNAAAQYFQGTTVTNGGAGVVMGDGLRCAGGAVVRLATKTNVAGTSHYPAAGDASIAAAGGVSSAGRAPLSGVVSQLGRVLHAASLQLDDGGGGGGGAAHERRTFGSIPRATRARRSALLAQRRVSVTRASWSRAPDCLPDQRGEFRCPRAVVAAAASRRAAREFRSPRCSRPPVSGMVSSPYKSKALGHGVEVVVEPLVAAFGSLEASKPGLTSSV